MTYVKINDTLYPVIRIFGAFNDAEWDYRSSKTILLEMDYAMADSLFTDNIIWSTVESLSVMKPKTDENGDVQFDENGVIIYEHTEQINEIDCSDYCVAGPLTNNRDGTVSAKMGCMTPLEQAYELLLTGDGNV